MTQTHTVRRHPDGSIDFDFYRANAIALRRQTLRDFVTLKIAGASVLATIATLALVVFIAASPSPASQAATATAQTQALQVW